MKTAFFISYFDFIWFCLQHAGYVLRHPGRVTGVDGILLFVGAFFVFNLILLGWSVYKRWFCKREKRDCWWWAIGVSIIFYLIGCLPATAFGSAVASV